MKLKPRKIGFGFSSIGIAVTGLAALALAGGAGASHGVETVHLNGQLTAYTQPARSAATGQMRGYTVRSGDTLAGIAGKEYGSARCWPGIYTANTGVVRNPDVIYVGQSLRIPGECGTRGPVRTVTVTTAKTSQPPASGGSGYSVSSSFQACVIRAESGGNPRAVNPASGAGGLYGFLPSTWASIGFSGLPEDASPAVQTEAFWKEYDLMGVSPWQPSDHC